ncbi:glycosyltransferase family 9 protein [Rhodopila sp.]|uniref:glycosyltransferase family 9 protein n=1 Tax=Rhodopila sp. TaxID=2480087 RepID=UPI002CAC1BFE|nr:glycosyltransferase family 9 protein [Rhodopila sp.]HVZ10615.1 glycosyltransferase family 9 protein [Rhodopila sp.]
MTSDGQPDEAVLRLARTLARWRNRLAPPGSLPSRLVRRLAGTLRRPADPRAGLRQRYLAWPAPRQRVETWDAAAPGGRALPPAPRILLLKLDHIGDLAVALPAFRRLRAGFPDARITLACGPWNTGLAAAVGLFDRVVGFDAFDANRRIGPADESARQARFAALALGPFDLAADFRHEPDTRTLLLAVDATFRAGFQAPAHAGGTRLDLAVPDCQDALRAAGAPPIQAGVRLDMLATAIVGGFARHAAEPLSAAAAAVPPVMPSGAPAATLSHSPAAVPPAGQRGYVVMAPGAGAPIKRWPLDRLTALAADLAERHGLDVVVTGGRGDCDDAASLAAALPPGRVRDLTGTLPLTDLPPLLLGARLFVGYDSGPSHLAAVLGVPTVCIFAGVSDAAVWHPVGPAVTVIAGRTGCSPCRLTHAAECPNDRACLTAISVETVRTACERRMALPA